MSTLIYRGGIWGPEKLSHFLKVTESVRGHWWFKPRQPDFNPRLCLLSLFDLIWNVIDWLFEWSELTIRWIPHIFSNLVILVIFFCIWKSRASVRTTVVGTAALKGPLRGLTFRSWSGGVWLLNKPRVPWPGDCGPPSSPWRFQAPCSYVRPGS